MKSTLGKNIKFKFFQIQKILHEKNALNKLETQSIENIYSSKFIYTYTVMPSIPIIICHTESDNIFQ